MIANLEYYKTFYTVAKLKSMTKASEELQVSQPAISKSIRMLEGQLGGTLFNRSNKGLELTMEGQMLYEKIRPALDSISNAEISFQEYKKLDTGIIKIGISSVLTKCLLIDILSEFKEMYPNVKFVIQNGLTSDLMETLNEGKLDFVIYNESNIEEKNVNSKLLTTLSYVFIYNKLFYDIDTNSFRNDSNIAINILNSYPLLLQNKSSNTRKFLDEYTDSKLVPYMEVVSQDLICNFVDAGLGIGFVFEQIADRVNPKFKKIKLKDVPKSKVYVATNKTINPSFAAKTFLKELKNRL